MVLGPRPRGSQPRAVSCTWHYQRGQAHREPAFSTDSKWAAFSIGYSEDQADRMRKENKPVENKVGLLNLGNGEQTVLESIESFAFSPTGRWVAMRRYAPPAAGGGGRGAAAPGGMKAAVCG